MRPGIRLTRRKLMKVREIMSRDVQVVCPSATLEEAAKLMDQLDIGSLPVCDGERLVGMITDRDITLRATAEGRDPKTTRVREVMTPDVAYCFEDQELEEVARKMELHQMRRMVILNRDKRLVGIVSVDDLAARAQEEELAGEVLEEAAAS
jgi:CBS domain-containing protein